MKYHHDKKVIKIDLDDLQTNPYPYIQYLLSATNSDRCHQPLNVGVGNANLPRWYFNPLTQQCQSCVYKGLQGNENNFVSKQDCENSCLGKFPPLNSPLSIDSPLLSPFSKLFLYSESLSTWSCLQESRNNCSMFCE